MSLMQILVIVLLMVFGLTALLAAYYTVRDLAADLVLLGGAALMLLAWLVLGVALLMRDLGGGEVGDPVTLYGYLLTAVVLPVGGAWLGVWERSRWGSLAIGVVALTSMVLVLRLEQIWPGGFA